MIIIDFSIILHSNFWIIHKKMESGELGAYDLSKMVNTSIMKLKRDLGKYGSELVLCLDSKEMSWRKQFCQSYKESRKPNDTLNNAKPVVYKNLSLYKTVKHPGMEADDWGYLLSRKVNRGILVSNDEDWFQFIKPGVKLMKFRNKEILTSKDIDVEWEAFLKIMKGCPSDEIPPVVPPRTRKTTIRKAYDKRRILRQHGTDGYPLVEQITDACADVGLYIDEKQLLTNIKVASYSIYRLKSIFNNDWHIIEDKLKKC